MPEPAPLPSTSTVAISTPTQTSSSSTNNSSNTSSTNNTVTSISLDKSNITLDLSGTKSATLKASVNPSSAQTSFTWSTSNKKVATVSKTGVVTAQSVGTATITIKTSNNKTATCKVTVQNSNTKTRAAFIAALDKFSKQVKKDGNWGYYNSMKTNGWTFKEARAKKRRSAQCAALPYWGLVEIGILDPGDSFYGKDGKIYWRKEASTKAKLKKYAKIIKVNKTPNQLLKSNNLKVGDICLWGGHTNVYAGNGKWYDAGHASCTTYKGSYSYDRFRSFGPVKNSMNSTVYYIIRLNN